MTRNPIQTQEEKLALLAQCKSDHDLILAQHLADLERRAAQSEGFAFLKPQAE